MPPSTAIACDTLRKRYPQARLVIAADDDRTKVINAGRKHASATHQAVGAPAVFPPFTAGHPKTLSDWNDLDQYPLAGYDRNLHRRHLRQAVAAELAHHQHPRKAARIRR